MTTFLIEFSKGKASPVFPFFCFIVVCLSANCQSTEVGGGLGGFSYTGDINRGYDFLQNRPTVSIYHRTNLSDVVSFRAGITTGILQSSDKQGNIDVTATLRNTSFNLFMIEASGIFEYHFLDWRGSKSLVRWTPYLYGGVGMLTFSGQKNKPEEYSNVQPVLPFGLGFKYTLNPRWYLGIEFGGRKLFFDYIDNVSGAQRTLKNYKYGNPNDNDMYYHIGITINYTFYTIPCPFLYR